MDYEKEVSGIKETLNWFKPVTGEYKIHILTEPKEFEFKTKDKEGKEKTERAYKLDIETKGNKLAWSFSRGETYASLYGQLMLVGKSKNGLAGKTITLIVKSDGSKNTYIILEALPLISEYQKPKVEEVR